MIPVRQEAVLSSFIRIFIQAIGLGLGVGLVLSGALAVIYHGLHPGLGSGLSIPYLYLYFVGAVMGLFAGWALALQRVLNHLFTILFQTAAQLVPLSVDRINREWTDKIQEFFQEVLKPFPKIFQWVMVRFFISRFKDPDRLNRAFTRTQNQSLAKLNTIEGMTRTALHYFLEPLYVAFTLVYVMLSILAIIFWAIPFIGL